MGFSEGEGHAKDKKKNEYQLAMLHGTNEKRQL